MMDGVEWSYSRGTVHPETEGTSEDKVPNPLTVGCPLRIGYKRTHLLIYASRRFRMTQMHLVTRKVKIKDEDPLTVTQEVINTENIYNVKRRSEY